MNRKKKFEWYGVIRVTAAILIALLIAAAIIFAVADDPGCYGSLARNGR